MGKGQIQTTTRFKLAILGDKGVGKKSYVHLLKTGKCLDPSTRINIGAPEVDLDILINGVPVKTFLFWKNWDDTKAPIAAIQQAFYKGTNGIIVIYDITQRPTFNHVQDYLADVAKCFPQGLVPTLILGNKNDLSDGRQVSLGEGQSLVKVIGGDCMFLEISCRTGSGVKESLKAILNRYVKRHAFPPI